MHEQMASTGSFGKLKLLPEIINATEYFSEPKVPDTPCMGQDDSQGLASAGLRYFTAEPRLRYSHARTRPADRGSQPARIEQLPT